MGTEASDLPLAVDMDGTLILSDMSRISVRRVLSRKPWLIPSVILKELRGKRAEWKRDLGRILVFNPSDLEYHEGFLEWLTGEHARGRVLILATASDRIVAEQVAAHVGMFSDVMASDNDYNLRDKKKAEALVARYGENGFGYAGNSHHDIAVWEKASQVIVVNPDPGVLDRVGNSVDIVFE